MRNKLLFLILVAFQSVLLLSFLGLASIFLREERFDHAVRIGWPAIFFTAFDAKKPTLNYSGDIGAAIVDFTVAFLIVIAAWYSFRKLRNALVD